MHDNFDDLIESALNSKLLSINLNSQRLEVKNIVEQPTERRTQEPEYSLSMGYEHPNTTPETKSDEIIKSGVEELVPILNKCEITSEDKNECDVLVCNNSSTFDIFDSNNNDDISSDDDAFKDIKYVEASLPESKLKEENDVYQEEEEVDLEDIFQMQDIILREKLLSINRLIANIETLHDNHTPDYVLSLHPHFLSVKNPIILFQIIPHPNLRLLTIIRKRREERLTSVAKSDISDDLSNDPLLEEVDLFLASDNLIPLGIENFSYDLERDISFLKELLIDDSIPFPNNESFDFEDDPFYFLDLLWNHRMLSLSLI
nr:hypothetical protein [Tanacetum cinerariifolium]